MFRATDHQCGYVMAQVNGQTQKTEILVESRVYPSRANLCPLVRLRLGFRLTQQDGTLQVIPPEPKQALVIDASFVPKRGKKKGARSPMALTTSGTPYGQCFIFCVYSILRIDIYW